MRALRRNKHKLYYARHIGDMPLLDENLDEVDTCAEYETPVEFHANISPNSGNPYAKPFGLEVEYDCTIFVAENLPIEEGTRIWKNTAPNKANDGTTADYYVIRVAKSLNGTVYAVKTVTHGTQALL